MLLRATRLIRSATAAKKHSPLRLEECVAFSLLECNWTVQGHSCAGQHTGYWIQGPNLVVDCGLATSRQPHAVFVTHRHTDHSLGLHRVVSCRATPKKGQELLGGRPVLLPVEAAPMLAHLSVSVAWLADGGPVPPPVDKALERLGIFPIPVTPGDQLEVPGVPNVRVEVLQGHHGDDIQSVGYGFSEVRRKLKAEFQGLPGKEIAQARAAFKAAAKERAAAAAGAAAMRRHRGVVPRGVGDALTFEQRDATLPFHQVDDDRDDDGVTEVVVTPLLLMYGDTTPDALLLHDEWRKYPNIFIEATGSQWQADPAEASKEVQARRQRNHSDINELLPLIANSKQDRRRWFLHHLSAAADLTLTRQRVAEFTSLHPGLDVVLVVQ